MDLQDCESVFIHDYADQPVGLRRWCHSRRIPSHFWNRFRGVSDQRSISFLLRLIRKELFAVYGKKRDYARSLVDSRLMSVPV